MSCEREVYETGQARIQYGKCIFKKTYTGIPYLPDVCMLEVGCKDEVLRGKSYLNWVGAFMRMEKDIAISLISSF